MMALSAPKKNHESAMMMRVSPGCSAKSAKSTPGGANGIGLNNEPSSGTEGAMTTLLPGSS